MNAYVKSQTELRKSAEEFKKWAKANNLEFEDDPYHPYVIAKKAWQQAWELALAEGQQSCELVEKEWEKPHRATLIPSASQGSSCYVSYPCGITASAGSPLHDCPVHGSDCAAKAPSASPGEPR